MPFSASINRRSEQSAFADIESELLELSFRGLLPTVVLGFLGMFGASLVVAYVYHDWIMYMIAIVMAALGAVRAVWLRRMEKNGASRERFRSSSVLQVLFAIIVFLYYNTLAISSLWNFHWHRHSVERLCSMGIFIMCLGINGRIATNPPIAKFYGLWMLAVLAFCAYDRHDPIAVTAVVLIALFSVAHCHAVQEKFDIVVEQIRNQRKLRMLSERDALTGLMNRRGFTMELETLCKRGAPFAVLYIDLDHFKPVNDRLGHGAGDELLRAVGERLTSLVRAEDVVARLGGDEFAILQMPATERVRAEALAVRVNAEIGAAFPIAGEMVQIGATVGVAVTGAHHVESSQLLAEADSAMYRAKEAGRGSYACAMV